MRLKCIFIKGLFGKFNHKISLNEQDKITIIHSPNGYGKTTILKILNHFFKGEFNQFKNIPFFSIHLLFDDGRVVNVYKNFFFLASQSLNDNNYDQILLKKPLLDKSKLRDPPSSKENWENEFDLITDERIFFENKPEGFDKWEIFAYDFTSFESIPRFTKNKDFNKISIIKEIIKQKNEDKAFLSNLINKPPGFEHYDNDYTSNQRKAVFESMMSKEQIYLRNKHYPNTSYIDKKNTLELPDFLKEIIESFSIQLIESQRLIYYNKDNDKSKNKNWENEFGHRHPRREGSNLVYTVTKCSDDIKEKMFICYERYSYVSQKLDKTFPNRLLDATISGGNNGIHISSLISEFEDLEKLQNELYKLGLYSSEDVNLIRRLHKSRLERETLLALKLYVDDNKEKMQVFSDLQRKMQNFSKIINELFVKKSIKYSLDEGFIFLDIDTNIKLSPDQLSSGEQHLIVLFYDLLFRSNEHSFILIDEPEISLHVGWQRKFIEIISDIIKVVDMDVIVSTHSPSIVHDRMDLIVQLTGD